MDYQIVIKNYFCMFQQEKRKKDIFFEKNAVQV